MITRTETMRTTINATMKTKRAGRVRALLSAMLAAVLCMTVFSAALASEGDLTLMRFASANGLNTYINNAFVTEDAVYLQLNGSENGFLRYTDLAGEGEKFILEQEETNYFFLTDESGEDAPVVIPNTLAWFAWGNDLYALTYNTVYQGDISTVEGGWIKKVSMRDGKVTMEETDLPQVDLTPVTEEYGESQGIRWISKSVVSGDYLVGQSYDNGGQPMLVVFDLKTGYASEISVSDIEVIYPGPVGSVLASRYEWQNEGAVNHILRVDLVTQEEEEIAAVTNAEGTLQALCFDEAADTLYYVADGRLWAAPGMNTDAAEAVNTCSGTYGLGALLLPGSRMLLWSQEIAFVRSTDPSLQNAYSLNIQNYAYSDAIRNAVYDFTDAHGNIDVLILQNGDPSGVLQAMLNRDDQADIYTMEYSSGEFDALRTRGFLWDMSGNARLSDAAGRMFPFAQDAVMRDGHLTAIPVSLSGSTMGYSAKVLEKMGMTEADLPRTWDAFFDALPELHEKAEAAGFSLFDSWSDEASVRSAFLTQILNQYQVWLNQGEVEYAFSTPMLLGLLEHMAGVDLRALGIMETRTEEDMEEGGGVSYDGEYKEPLFTTYTPSTLSTWTEQPLPLPLSLSADQEPIMPLYMTVAFINPYSRHAEDAAEFLACALENLSDIEAYSLFTDRTEPQRYPNFEEEKENTRKWLEQAKAQLEKTDDEEQRENLESYIQSMEEYLAGMDETAWFISPAAIEQYRTRVQYLRPLSWDMASSLISSSDDVSYWNLTSDFCAGRITAAELLGTIDKKVQMMRLEGN